jgi:electron transfer flavoprotein beta subunit
MKILVCIGHVPDTTTKVKFTDENRKLDTTGIQWVINPWDELSLTRALELKDDPAAKVQSVTVAHVGLVGSEPTIRKALAIGADDAFRVNTEPGDAYFVAAQLARVIRENQFDLVFCGIESSDYNGSMVGGMISAFLDCTLVSSVSGIRIEQDQVIFTREIDGGREILTAPTPAVAVVQKGIAKEPRIAAMRGIMMARTKPLKVVEPETVDFLTETVSFELPKPRAACKFADPENPAQLIEMLQNEAKIL